jgi:hypothetical protein
LREDQVIPLLLLLIATAVVFGLGFATTWLFIVAGVLFAIWAVGLFVGRGRWYGWR